LAVVRRILNLSARLWRDEADRPWIDTAPLIQMQRHPNKRDPYPLSDEEQRLLFSELDGHLAAMALFKVNTGLREKEVVNLRWHWEVPVAELNTSVFIIPRSYVKNGLDRYVVLNRIAKSVISERRGEHASLCSPAKDNPSRRSTTRVGRRRGAERQCAMQRSLEEHVRRDFSPSGCMISNTRMVIACGWPAWASRIGNSC
jgi:integrase